MATKKTTTPEKPATKKPVAAKKPPKAVAAKVARGPRAVMVAKHGTKEKLVGTLVGPLAQEGQDADGLRARLLKASNQQLLHLARTVETVTKKYGSRAKLITAITTAENKAKDKDFVAKLGALSLPNLLDLALSAERRAR
jgi:hypothetical protein